MIQFFELISQRFDRHDRVAEQRKFLLESSDMDVDRPCRSVVIVPPDRIEEDLPGQDSAGIAQEVFEQAKLFGSEQGLYFIDGDFVPCEIHDEIAIAVEGRAVVRFPLKPSEQSLDAGNQGLGTEWFDDVVVGSQIGRASCRERVCLAV